MAQEKEGAVGWEERGKRREDEKLMEASAPVREVREGKGRGKVRGVERWARAHA